jgi:competence CoiA-like predicted nuclease
MEKEAFQNLSAEEQRNFYRCPACGEMVDNRRLDEIVRHHAHVLHPNHFVSSKSTPARRRRIPAGDLTQPY